MKYGYINEHGYLVTKEVTDIEESFTNSKGENRKRIIRAQETIEMLSVNGFKPVDEIDVSKMRTKPEDEHVIFLKPYDNGDRISYRYEKVFDHQKIKSKIKALKADLADSDFKIIKCYEASLIRKPFPYNMIKLNKERQLIRKEINNLERILLKKVLDK